jgi:hypothetical protein
MGSKYDGDGNLEVIDPSRLTLGCVLRMPYKDGSVSAFGDNVVIGMWVSYSPKRAGEKGTDRKWFYNLQEAMDHCHSDINGQTDYVFVQLARPYAYANTIGCSANFLLGVEKYEVMGHRIQDSHKVVVQSTGQYANYSIL